MRQYLDMVERVFNEGKFVPDRTGVGRLRLFGFQSRYNLQEGFPMVTTKHVPFKSVLTELLWFLSGSSDERDLCELQHGTRDEEKKTIWSGNLTDPKWVKKQGGPTFDVGFMYGRAWRDFEGIDQLKRLQELMVFDPTSSRLIVTAYHPKKSHEEAVLYPCHTFFQVFVDTATMEFDLQLYQRSADLFLGVPFNIASYALLMIILGEITGLTPREFIHTIGDAHIYSNHLEQVGEMLTRSPYATLPKLVLNPDKEFLSFEDFKLEDFTLENYLHHPAIKAPMAV